MVRLRQSQVEQTLRRQIELIQLDIDRLRRDREMAFGQMTILEDLQRQIATDCDRLYRERTAQRKARKNEANDEAKSD